ncbi:MAG: hypothetical protein ACK5II_05350 [Paracoccus sp. (in: a-proteobacteria)]
MTRVLDIGGRAATVIGLGKGLILDPGQRFRVDLTNNLDEPTLNPLAWTNSTQCTGWCTGYSDAHARTRRKAQL